MGVPKIGTAYSDGTLDEMFETYGPERCAFFVVVVSNEIVGCGGIAPLMGFTGDICELQKMYVAPKHQRLGIGSLIIERCLETAMNFGYHACYLETLPEMNAAQALYVKNGFEYLGGPLGNTGHHNCSVRMLKKFDANVA